MPNNIITGNALLDKLASRPLVSNTNYNSKTKKGKKQSKFISDLSVPNIGNDFMSNTMRSVRQLSFTGAELGKTNEQIEEDADLDIGINPYNSEDELNKARAENQSNFAKAGNALMKAGIGEIVLGTLEGFGNILDGVINTFTGDAYDINPYTRYMSQLKKDFDDNFKIYQEHPGESWGMDFGWAMNGLVNVATTASLMLPALGWARAVGTVGKLSRLNKLGKWAASGVAKGISKAGTKLSNTGKFNAANNIANKAARIEKSIVGGSSIIGTAALSRAGEGYMEAKAIYDDIYNSSKENLENMPDNEYQKFLANNPEFKDMDKDDIAKTIARKSANRTFYNDYWMLLMDIPQFKALGSIWGNTVKRTSKAGERIAAKNVKRQLAGAKAEDLIKNNIWNRSKEGVKYALKNPKDSFFALELGEGFEEMYQGIQSEKGMEVATKYFNPKFTPRTLGSYLSDGSIWEQGFWGSLGGVLFNKIGAGVRQGRRTIESIYNKKHMTADEYEKWKRSEDKIAIEQINNTTNSAKEFIEEMKQINDNINPYNFVVDERTGRKIIKNGNVVNETITDTQKDLLHQEAIKKFVDNTTLESIDNGTYELMKDILGSNEFDQYITNNGVQISKTDKLIGQQVVDRMKDVSGKYYKELDNVTSLADTTNPFISIAVARNITRNKLAMEDYDDQISSIDLQIAEENDTNTNYDNYTKETIYNEIQKIINSLDRQKADIERRFYSKEISMSAYKTYIEQINKNKKSLINYLANNTTRGAFNQVKEMLQQDFNDETLAKEFDKFTREYQSEFKADEDNVPTDNIRKLIHDKIDLEVRKSFTESQIPATQKDYEVIYNEFADAMDQVTVDRIHDYIITVSNYLKEADNFDEALRKVINENTSNKKVDEALHYLKYGYVNYNADPNVVRGRVTTNFQFDTMIENIRKEREKLDKRTEDARQQGIEIPIGNESEPQQQSSSTGSQIENNDDSSDEVLQDNEVEQYKGFELTEPIVLQDNVLNNIPNTPLQRPVEEGSESTGVQITPDEKPIVDNTIPIEDNPLELDTTEQELKENAAIAAGYETQSAKAAIDAGTYITQIAFKEEGRFDDIVSSMNNGDTTKYDAFIKEVVDFLVNRNYSNTLAERIAAESFASTVQSFSIINGKDTFRSLAEQLAIGFDAESAKKHSITELINLEAIDQVIDKFLEEYCKQIENNKLGDGRYIINLEQLFNYIINTPSIEKVTATHIYDNICEYLAKNDGSKYIFTGYDKFAKLLNADEFFNRLAEKKANKINSTNLIHIHLVEEKTKAFDEALLAAANGAKAYVNEFRNNEGTVVALEVYIDIKKGKKTIPVKIGILRTVEANKDFTEIYPVSHYSGFGNRITVANNQINLDCDFLFNALIKERGTNPAAKQLFKELVEYRIAIKTAYDKHNLGILNDKQLQVALDNAMDEAKAKRILDNELIKEIYEKGIYRDGADKEYRKLEPIDAARTVANSISSILFYDHHFNDSDPINDNVDSMSIDNQSMANRYKDWKSSVYNNYKHTYEMQKGFSDNNRVEIDLNVASISMINTIEDRDEFPNIADAGFDVDPKSKNYTPFVIVNKQRTLIDENGEKRGFAGKVLPFSAGFLVYDKNGVRYVAYCNTAQELSGTKLKGMLRDEFASIITKQLTNKNNDNADHFDMFNELFDRLSELIGNDSLFRFGNNNIRLTGNKQNGYVTVQSVERNNDGSEKRTNLITLFLNNKNGSNSNAIGLYIPRLGKQVPITAIANTTLKDGGYVTEDEVKAALNSNIETILSSIKLNKSMAAVTGVRSTGATPKIFRRENGKFILTLGGKDYVYNNYGDFILQHRAFNTNVNGYKGGFVTEILLDNQVSINMRIKDTSQIEIRTDTDVSDLLFNKYPNKKTVPTKDVLKAAKVDQDKIDLLLGTYTGIPIVTKNVQRGESDNKESNAYYKRGRVYITEKGAISMNNNPKNAVRIILHENLHRLFHNKQNYTNKQRKRIIEELKEVYEYTLEQIDKDLQAGKINKTLHDNIISVFKKATSYGDDIINMEEFLMECLTQREIAKYLNNTEYKYASDISGISNENKSIFQKIIDILLDLLDLYRFGTTNINNNSILAREYLILSKTNNNTDNGLFNEEINNESTEQPVQSAQPVEQQEEQPVEGEPQRPVEQDTTNEQTDIPDDLDATINRMLQEDEDENLTDNIDEYDIYDEDDIEYDDDLEREAATELINTDENEVGQTPAEIYATPIADGKSDNPYGVCVVNDMNAFVESFPIQYRGNIKQLIASNELNYTCQ